MAETRSPPSAECGMPEILRVITRDRFLTVPTQIFPVKFCGVIGSSKFKMKNEYRLAPFPFVSMRPSGFVSIRVIG